MRRRETYSIRKTANRSSSRYSRDSGLEDEFDQTTSFLSRGSNNANQLESAIEHQSSESEAYEVFENTGNVTQTNESPFAGSSREIHCPNRCIHGSQTQSAHLVTNDIELLYDPSTLRHLRAVFKFLSTKISVTKIVVSVMPYRMIQYQPMSELETFESLHKSVVCYSNTPSNKSRSSKWK